MKHLTILTIATLMLPFVSLGNERAISLVKSFEGFKSSPYHCEAGKVTIGYGFTSQEMIAKGYITEKEANKEVFRMCQEIAKNLKVELGNSNTLKPNEEAAVVSFIYNVGWANFKASTMCRLLKEGKRGALVGAEFHKWVYVSKGNAKVVSKGLKNRRHKEAMCFMCG